MTIPVDNGIIDYNALSSIYTQLATHEDFVSQLEQNSLVTIIQGSTSSSGPTSQSGLGAASFQIAAASWGMPSETITTVPLGASFSQQPIITATVQSSTGNKFVAQISQISADVNTAIYASVDIIVYCIDKPGTKVPVTVNITAVGQK